MFFSAIDLLRLRYDDKKVIGTFNTLLTAFVPFFSYLKMAHLPNNAYKSLKKSA